MFYKRKADDARLTEFVNTVNKLLYDEDVMVKADKGYKTPYEIWAEIEGWGAGSGLEYSGNVELTVTDKLLDFALANKSGYWFLDLDKIKWGEAGGNLVIKFQNQKITLDFNR